MSLPSPPDFRVDRRTLFKAALGAGLTGLPLGRPARAEFKAFPFSLGVASGEPAADGFVIWTRLAPEPLAPWGRHDPGTGRGCVGDRRR
jgi:alkaline phosphatase D